VFWAQALSSFGLWIAYGVYQSRRSAKVRAWAQRFSPASRGLAAAGLFLTAALVMFGGLMAIITGKGLGPSGLAGWAWLLVVCVGLVFVHIQTLAMALLVVSAQEAVTRERRDASETSTRQGISSDEAPPS